MTIQSTMHQQQVIMWLGVELAEKKSRIVDLENENRDLEALVRELTEKLTVALADPEDPEDPPDKAAVDDGA